MREARYRKISKSKAVLKEQAQLGAATLLVEIDNVPKQKTCLQMQYLTEIFTARCNARIASAVPATAIPSICHTPVLCQNDCT